MKKLLILSLLIMAGCGSDRLCRKAERMGCFKQSSDTVILHDSIKGWSYDTAVQFLWVHDTDTLTVEKNGIITKTVTVWKERKVLQTITQKDTVKDKVVITNTKTLKPDLKWYQKWWFPWILVVILISYLLFMAANKITYIR